MTARIKVTTRQNILAIEYLNDLVTSDEGLRGIDFKHHVLIVAALVFIVRKKCDAIETGQFVCVLAVVLAIDDDEVV